ncbi:MAG TPA: META domain-containing protein [Pyrinomonadaceae bacterium]|nr:META domain-containing protein [Pyrinomonadaceae bacterium]
MSFRSGFLALVLVAAIGDGLLNPAQSRKSFSTGDQPLANTEWHLVSFGRVGEEKPVIQGTTITMKFDADGRVNGSAGCNSYSGTYRVRGDLLTFGRMASTMRACLDSRANQQEQQYFAALDSATRFRLSGNRLLIYYDSARSALNFVNNSPSSQDETQADANAGPTEALKAYYQAINEKQYEKAYRYWKNPTVGLDQFSRGFADTISVRLLVEPTPLIEGAAGSLFAEVPTVVIAQTNSGRERVFAGCYVMRRSNVEEGDRWHIYKASISPVTPARNISSLLQQGCQN